LKAFCRLLSPIVWEADGTDLNVSLLLRVLLIFPPLLGGFCVTGTIARTATNARAGSKGPLSGIFHSLFVLLFILAAAPLASYIPLSSLAAILTVVAWNMIEKTELWTLIRCSKADAVVLNVTFLLVVFRNLTEGILVGFGLGSPLFLHRMAQSIKIENYRPLIEEDIEDTSSKESKASLEPFSNKDLVVLRIFGAFLFGSAASVAIALDRIAEKPKIYVLDFSTAEKK
jgi:SulP family sulfate permease